MNTIFEHESLLSKLTFTHTVSCRNRSYKIVEQENMRLLPEPERTTRLTNCRTI